MSNNTSGLSNEMIAKMWQEAMERSSLSATDNMAVGSYYAQLGYPSHWNQSISYPGTATASGGNIYSGHTHTMAGIQQAGVYTPHMFPFQDMIRMRLGLTPGAPLPFQFLEHYKVSSEKHIVFVVQGGKPVIIEDGELFPSDQLITQLRLIAT
jgi:hypothetical protein